MWKQNLFSNLLVVGILGSLAVIVYCKVTNKTLLELIKEIRGAFSQEDE